MAARFGSSLWDEPSSQHHHPQPLAPLLVVALAVALALAEEAEQEEGALLVVVVVVPLQVAVRVTRAVAVHGWRLELGPGCSSAIDKAAQQVLAQASCLPRAPRHRHS